MLHGEIKVNDTVIMEWTARRLQFLEERGNGMYEYHVTMRDTQTDEYIDTVIWHKYIDGAAVLVSRIMNRWDAQHGLRGSSGSGDLSTAIERQDRIRAGEREARSGGWRVSLSDSDVSPSSGDGSESDGAR